MLSVKEQKHLIAQIAINPTVILAIMNHKGGVGKTTTALNLAFKLSEFCKVLLVELDNQCNITKGFCNGIIPEKNNIYNLFNNEDVVPMNYKENLDFIPSMKMSKAIIDLIDSQEDSRSILKYQLDKIEDNYDFIIIDCPPNLSSVTANAMIASDRILIPTKPAKYDIDGFDAMIPFVTSARKINTDLGILGILFTHCNGRFKITKKIIENLKSINLDRFILNTKIRDTTDIPNSQDVKNSIFEYKPYCGSAKDYNNLTFEILNKLFV